MKRINPDTGKPFKRGDKRPSSDVQDNRVFFQYYTNVVRKKSGYFKEGWLFPNNIQNHLEKKRLASRKKYKTSYSKYPKRNNPNSGKPFKQGDKKGNLIFFSYRPKEGKDGFRYEEWLTMENFKKEMIKNRIKSAKYRAKKSNLPFNLTYKYVNAIYPQDNRCPIFGFILKFGGNDTRDNSPSLDKIKPSEGYIEGNVIWVSMKANAMKNNGTVDDLEKIAKFYRRLENEKR